CLKSLNPEDRFAVITFNDVVDLLTDELVSVKSDDKETVIKKVGNIEANGGTNINGALEKAFQFVKSDKRPTYMLFLTDGLPTVGERDEHAILKHAEEWNKHQA